MNQMISTMKFEGLGKKDRLPFFDLLKGMAIFLVVFGHCAQALVSNYRENPVWLAIYMFHMPLFPSGIVSMISQNKFLEFVS